MTTKLQELPEEFYPREKLAKLGRASLNNAELIAIFLRTGIKGKNVLSLASELITSAGSLDALGRMEAQEITKLCKGIGLAKAATLSAAFELGARAIQETAIKTPFTSADLVYDYLAPDMRWKEQETVKVLLVDTKCRLIKDIDISIGTLNESIAHPRDILRPCVIHNAYGFILAHNHPSGDPSPSRADHETTRKIKEASELLSINFLDHMIVGKPIESKMRNYYSYRQNNRL